MVVRPPGVVGAPPVAASPNSELASMSRLMRSARAGVLSGDRARKPMVTTPAVSATSIDGTWSDANRTVCGLSLSSMSTVTLPAVCDTE